MRTLSDLNCADRQRWAALAARTVEPNPFLTPEFVEPLCVRLVAPESVLLLVVEHAHTSDWLALALMQPRPSSLTEPLAGLQPLQSEYSFLDGLLVDQERGTEALSALMLALSQQRRWHGLHFATMRRHSPLSLRLDAASRQIGIRRVVKRQWSRAGISLEKPLTVERLLKSCSKSRRKSLRRARRRLESAGELKFELVAPGPDDSTCINEFLRLEQMGWKGVAGTALAEHPEFERFIRSAVQGFAGRGEVWFGRLQVNGRTIASTCNLRAGDTLFAFKIGWDPEFADCSPGFWSEIELAVAARKRDPTLRRIDSCSSPGSYVESVWPDRTEMQSTSYVWSRRGRFVRMVRQQLRNARRLLRNTVSRRMTSVSGRRSSTGECAFPSMLAYDSLDWIVEASSLATFI